MRKINGGKRSGSGRKKRLRDRPRGRCRKEEWRDGVMWRCPNKAATHQLYCSRKCAPFGNAFGILSAGDE